MIPVLSYLIQSQNLFSCTPTCLTLFFHTPIYLGYNTVVWSVNGDTIWETLVGLSLMYRALNTSSRPSA